MSSELTPQAIADFITHNNIDVTKHSMDEIVAGWMKAQAKLYAEIERKLKEMTPEELAKFA